MPGSLKYLSENEKTALAEIKRRVSGLFPVRQYIFFGSKARGDAAPDSDIDLLIVTERKLTPEERTMISHEIFEVNLANDTNFSRVVVDSEEWENGIISVLPFHDNVAKEGIPV